MTQTSTTRRVATVSGGALLLCLSFGGTALAATTPTSGTATSPISGVTDPLPLPSPSATPDPVEVVTQTVQQVAQTAQSAGVPVPTATPTAPAPAPSGGKTGTTKQAPAPVTKPAGSTTDRAVLGVHHARVAAAPANTLAHWNLSGLSAGTTVPSVNNPVVAPQQTAILAAGSAPALAPRVQPLLPGGGDEQAPRGLFIALATMVIGGLAAGHVKVIQDRLSGVSVG